MDAVRARRRLRITHRAGHSGETTTRTIDPLQLARVGNQWYCLAFDHTHRKVIPFVPSRMLGVERTLETFERREDFAAEVHLASAFRIFSTGRKPRRLIALAPAGAASP